MYDVRPVRFVVAHLMRDGSTRYGALWETREAAQLIANDCGGDCHVEQTFAPGPALRFPSAPPQVQ